MGWIVDMDDEETSLSSGSWRARRLLEVFGE